MAQLPIKYNTENNKEGMTDFTALPAGKYTMQIVSSKYKANKKKTGHLLQCQLKVIEGSCKGRVYFENLNLDNPNPIAVEIANKTLNSFCQACDRAGVEDSEELHGIPMSITLKVDKATSTNPESNSIAKIEAYNGDVQAEKIETPSETPETAGADVTKVAKKKLPWQK